ncbi:MAG: peptidoglycan DD-metalloendopeptidase family protein [Sulfuricellaceae bacterium]|nr:peptidoglycan DD-metalloendopeptidase family protein [Sulfuricellaceae bacterium]
MNRKKNSILSHIFSRSERKIPLRWLAGFTAIPFLGVVAAFGTAPDTDFRNVRTQTVVEPLSLPASSVDSSPSRSFWREERIQKGDSVASLLTRLNVNDEDIQTFLSDIRHAPALRQLKPGKLVQAQTSEDGKLLGLRYHYSSDTLLQVSRQADHFSSKEETLHLERQVHMKSGRIHSSLFAATDDANLPDSIAIQMAEIFSTDIDFHRDLQKGDQFSIVFESFYNHGEFIKSGRILAAEFVNNGKTYRAVYFQGRDGQGGYFTPEGKNLRKAFLRSPLEFSRISSGFMSARFHPILKEWRAHKGVDYAAPSGTRIKATADGVVKLIGKQNGYGNVISLQHQGKYETVYGHLSGFAAGLRQGQRVSQGDVIGYVGMTGMATGPHLHYEFKMAGLQRNPLSLEVPTAFPIAADQKQEFNRAVLPLASNLNLLHGTNLAALD